MVADFLGIMGCLYFLGSSLSSYLIARLICGFVMGLNSAMVPVFINEFSPAAISGLCGSLHQANICFGIVVSLIVGVGFKSSNASVQ